MGPPTLLPETGDLGSPQVAQVGRMVDLFRTGRECQFRFVQNPAVPRSLIMEGPLTLIIHGLSRPMIVGALRNATPSVFHQRHIGRMLRSS
jgi:hypothetical protein